MENSENTRTDGIKVVSIDQEMREAYLQYSMSVIVGRALPDIRDGLKPVHRRVLFAMSELGNYHDKPYKKSARVVGDVIGKYHPHGDSAVYDTIVRMAQDFSLRYPLVDGQGNFGSIDGDSAAAMRYTEIRMTRLAEELLEDIEKETVPFGPNYDDSLQIPLVMPAKYPSLLTNGASGIAVGMAMNIPPHNLTELCDGCLELIRNPSADVDDLLKFIKGPDFPTAGVISGRSGIIQAYKKGRGTITIKAVSEIITVKDREKIIVSEIPYQVNKARLIESIADLVRDKKIEGISDIRDESSREGMRIMIDIKRGENASVVLNRLYQFTQMKTSFGIIMMALDAKGKPRLFDLKEALVAFLDHRREVVTRRCIFELKKAEARAHILEGLAKALDNIDEVIATIKASKEADTAKTNLVAKFGFTVIQAQAILEMRLQRLTGLEREKLAEELANLMKLMGQLRFILSDVREIYKIIAGELEHIKNKYGDKRRTHLEEGEDEELEDEDLIAKEDVVVTVTETGYIKRISLDEYRSQKRGGRGIKGMETREEDIVSKIFTANTHTTLLSITDKGKLYWLKVYKVPEGNRGSKGKSIANVIHLSPGESVKAILPVEKFDSTMNVVMITKNGIIKKTSLEEFSRPRQMGIIALTTDLEDSVMDAKLSDGKSDIFLATNQGMSIRFNESDVREMGRNARGVKGISLGKDDFVVGMEVLGRETAGTLLMVSSQGLGKRTELSEYRTQSRGGVGIISQKVTDKTGDVVTTKLVTENNDIVIISDKGQVIRMKCSEISIIGRNTQGVRLVNLKSGEKVIGCAVVENEVAEESPEIKH